MMMMNDDDEVNSGLFVVPPLVRVYPIGLHTFIFTILSSEYILFNACVYTNEANTTVPNPHTRFGSVEKLKSSKLNANFGGGGWFVRLNVRARVHRACLCAIRAHRIYGKVFNSIPMSMSIHIIVQYCLCAAVCTVAVGTFYEECSYRETSVELQQCISTQTLTFTFCVFFLGFRLFSYFHCFAFFVRNKKRTKNVSTSDKNQA